MLPEPLAPIRKMYTRPKPRLSNRVPRHAVQAPRAAVRRCSAVITRILLAIQSHSSNFMGTPVTASSRDSHSFEKPANYLGISNPSAGPETTTPQRGPAIFLDCAFVDRMCFLYFFA